MRSGLFQTLFGSIWPIVLLFTVAAVTGAIAQAVVGRHHGGGCLASIGIGLVGALLGILLASWLGLPEIFSINAGGTSFPVVWALLGAMLLLVILRVARR
jgi:uncharacterized membrane protein YeaQ/YmgE (transglycosylase-associated protein family)